MLVLWVLTLLTIIAVALTATQRTESTLARNQLVTARFRATAEAGVYWTVLNFLVPPTEFEEDAETWIPDGSPHAWTFADATLEIRVFNETSRIDLNTAPHDLLVALLTAIALPEGQVNALVDAIEDWRDSNHLARLNGAEDDDYEDAGLAYGSKDGTFDTVQELQLVRGIDRHIYSILEPALTVDAGRAKLDPDFAPPLVQAALQGITLEEATLAQEARYALSEADVSEPTTVSRGGPLYRVRVTQMVEEHPSLSMEALVRIESGTEPPFRFLWRHFGLVTDPPVESSPEVDAAGADF